MGNVGLHYYEWRYEAPAREALANGPDRNGKRRRTKYGEDAGGNE